MTDRTDSPADAQPTAEDLALWRRMGQCAEQLLPCILSGIADDLRQGLNTDSIKFRHIFAATIDQAASALTKADAQAGPLTEREKFEAWLKAAPEWAPEFEVHRAWVERFAFFAWQARAALAAAATPLQPAPLAQEPADAAANGLSGTVPEAYPQRHARYLLERDGVTLTATPCYGLHEPWWVVRTLVGEAEPEPMRAGDKWRRA